MAQAPQRRRTAPARPKTAAHEGGPSRDAAVDALVHLARLAASQHGGGVTFSDPELKAIGEPDEMSNAALAKAVQILLADRERLRARMVDALITRAHRTVEEVFRAAQSDPNVAEQTEDLIEEELKARLGLGLTEAQKRKFAVDCKYIKVKGGPSDAAAEALGAALGLETGRSIHDDRRSARKRPSVPAPFNRWVPLRHVRRFANEAFDAAEERRRATPMVPLDALRAHDHAEALMDRVERGFKSSVHASFAAERSGLIALVRAALRGVDPVLPLSSAAQDRWQPLRAGLAAHGKLLMAADPTGASLEAFAVQLVDGFRTMLSDAF
jgi:hypothetical protein